MFQKNKYINKVYGNTLLEKHKVINKNYTEDKNFFYLSASHNGYKKKYGYIHTRSIKILKNLDKILGRDELKQTRKNSNIVIYFIRFHVYPNIKIVKTKSGKSVLFSLPNGEGWLLKNSEHIFRIEKNIFLGNKNKIINNESILISGKADKELSLIEWEIERVN